MLIKKSLLMQTISVSRLARNLAGGRRVNIQNLRTRGVEQDILYEWKANGGVDLQEQQKRWSVQGVFRNRKF